MKDQEQTLHGVRREVDGDRWCMAWASTGIRSEIGKAQPDWIDRVSGRETST
jgi:hypothetical protein